MRAGVVASAHVEASGGGGIMATFQQSDESPADLSSYTFAAKPIGAVSATRRVVVGVALRNASPTTVTIGGVSAAKVVENVDEDVSASQWIATVPTGTTADVVVVTDVGTFGCGIGVWTLSGGAATGQVGLSGNDLANLSMTVTTTPGDVVIGVMSYRIGSAVDVVWTGATERYAISFDGTVRVHSGADTVATGASTTLDVSITSFNADSIACAAAYA